MDRSWARRVRGSTGGIGHKKRPDLMAADFTGGNPAPTSPISESSPECEIHAATSVTAAPAGVLEPLPETSAVESIRKSPRRDWKQPLENTDVVGAMEAIEGT